MHRNANAHLPPPVQLHTAREHDLPPVRTQQTVRGVTATKYERQQKHARYGDARSKHDRAVGKHEGSEHRGMAKHENTTAQTNTSEIACNGNTHGERVGIARDGRRLSPESCISSSATRSPCACSTSFSPSPPSAPSLTPARTSSVCSVSPPRTRMQSTARQTRQTKKDDGARTATKHASRRATATHITRLTALELPMSTPSHAAGLRAATGRRFGEPAWQFVLRTPETSSATTRSAHGERDTYSSKNMSLRL